MQIIIKLINGVNMATPLLSIIKKTLKNMKEIFTLKSTEIINEWLAGLEYTKLIFLTEHRKSIHK